MLGGAGWALALGRQQGMLGVSPPGEAGPELIWPSILPLPPTPSGVEGRASGGV